MYENYIAVIQAGGKGTRMIELTHDEIPKPMLMLNGKPMIQWQVEDIKKYGIKEFVFIIGHLGENVKKYFGDGSEFGIHISYIEETEPLGSAGALFYLKNKGIKNFLLIFGDVMFQLAWDKMISFHEQHDGTATLLVHPNAHPYDSDLLIMDSRNCVMGIDSKHNLRNYWYNNCVNAGIYILSGEILDEISELQKCDLEKDILAPMMPLKKVYGYRTTEYVKDAGTPKRFRSVLHEQQQGIWDVKCLDKMQKAVFIDRDGTINVYKGLISREEDLELEECAVEAIKKLNASGYLAIIITNQPVVARGLCDLEDVKLIHKKMQVLLGEQGAFLDDIAFCPHHPDKGYPEENPLYKIKCNCRKPAIGMIEEMARKYNIDLKKSYFVGDTTRDIQTGKNAGTKTILVRTGQGGADERYNVKSDFEAENLLAAVEFILERGSEK